MLSVALQKAQSAVLLDQKSDVNGAIDAYAQACALLDEVLKRITGESEKENLKRIYNAYVDRMKQLMLSTSSNPRPNLHSFQSDPGYDEDNSIDSREDEWKYEVPDSPLLFAGNNANHAKIATARYASNNEDPKTPNRIPTLSDLNNVLDEMDLNNDESNLNKPSQKNKNDQLQASLPYHKIQHIRHRSLKLKPIFDNVPETPSSITSEWQESSYTPYFADNFYGSDQLKPMMVSSVIMSPPETPNMPFGRYAPVDLEQLGMQSSKNKEIPNAERTGPAPETPLPPEPIQEKSPHAAFWFMKTIGRVLSHPKGGYITNNLFIPASVWVNKGYKIKRQEERIHHFRTISDLIDQLDQVEPTVSSLLPAVQMIDAQTELLWDKLLKKGNVALKTSSLEVRPKKNSTGISLGWKKKKTASPIFSPTSFGEDQLRACYVSELKRLCLATQKLGKGLFVLCIFFFFFFFFFFFI